MTDQFSPSEQACLLNPATRCDRIWVSQADALRLSHFQSLEKKKSIQKDGDVAMSIGNSQISDCAAYEQCVRGCLGPI
jgi:hypothetical protein